MSRPNLNPKNYLHCGKCGNPIWTKRNRTNRTSIIPSLICTHLEDLISTAPEYVENIVIETTFWFRGQKKKYQNTKPVWPPPECVTRSPSFTVPITSAYLVTLEETENVTRKIKKCAGPFGDFYGKKINPMDFFLTWEPNYINKFDFLEIVDVLGFKKQYPIE